MRPRFLVIFAGLVAILFLSTSPARAQDNDVAARNAEIEARMRARRAQERKLEADAQAEAAARAAADAAAAAARDKALKEAAAQADAEEAAERARQAAAAREGAAAPAPRVRPAPVRRVRPPMPADGPPRPVKIFKSGVELDSVIVGLTDSIPSAEAADDGRTVVTVHVLRTLKGIDQTGCQVKLATKQPLDAGRSYILSLKRDPFQPWGRIEAAEEPSDQKIKAIVADATEKKTPIEDARAVWMYRVDHLNGSRVEEFYATSAGKYSYTQKTSGPGKPEESESRSGQLPKEAISELIQAIAETPDQGDAGEASMATFRWVDETGVEQFKLYHFAANPPGKDLIDKIAEAARKHAAPTTQPAEAGKAVVPVP